MSRNFRLAGALALAATLGACDSSSGPANQGSAASLAIATRPSAAVPAPGGPQLSGAPVTYDDGTNILVINSVEMVVKEIELKRSEYPSQCDSTASDDQCEELESGPYLLDLPLSGRRHLGRDGGRGSWHLRRVRVQDPQAGRQRLERRFPGRPPDVRRREHPGHRHLERRGVHLRVGSQCGAGAGPGAAARRDRVGTADFTLFIDIGTWFRTSGNMLIDPSSANKGNPNESVVNNNIAKSFETFEDEDHDGEDDNSGEG